MRRYVIHALLPKAGSRCVLLMQPLALEGSPALIAVTTEDFNGLRTGTETKRNDVVVAFEGKINRTQAAELNWQIRHARHFCGFSEALCARVYFLLAHKIPRHLDATLNFLQIFVWMQSNGASGPKSFTTLMPEL